MIVGYADLLLTRDDEQLRREGAKRILEAAEALRRQIDAVFDALDAATPD